MDLRSSNLHIILLLLSSQLFLNTKGDGGRSVVFFDSPNHRFLRGGSTELGHESGEMSVEVITSAVSVLLGFAPPHSLSDTSSSKLDALLLPNPFNRPRAVLMIEVRGAEDLINSKGLSNAFSYKFGGSDKELIVVPAEEELSVIPIDEPLNCISCLDKEFADLALLLGGTYVGTMEALDGILTFALPSGTSLVLHVSESSNLQYARSLASFVRGIKKAAQMHDDFSGRFYNPAELLMGTFTGIEALNDCGSDVAQKGVEVFQATLTKMLELLHKHYEGRIVGIVIFNKGESLILPYSSDMMSAVRASRILQRATGSTSFGKEVVLVRRTLAWITGILLVVATLIGTYLLLNMPLTRDTLLYSNVKLD